MLEVIQIFLNHVRQEGELGLPDVGDAGDPEVFRVRKGIFGLRQGGNKRGEGGQKF